MNLKKHDDVKFLTNISIEGVGLRQWIDNRNRAIQSEAELLKIEKEEKDEEEAKNL